MQEYRNDDQVEGERFKLMDAISKSDLNAEDKQWAQRLVIILGNEFERGYGYREEEERQETMARIDRALQRQSDI